MFEPSHMRQVHRHSSEAHRHIALDYKVLANVKYDANTARPLLMNTVSISLPL